MKNKFIKTLAYPKRVFLGLLSVLVVGGVLMSALIAQETFSASPILFSDSFENTPPPHFPKWTSSDSLWRNTSGGAQDGTRKALVTGDTAGDGVLRLATSTAGYTDIELSFWYNIESLEAASGDGISVEWFDGTNWNEAESFADGDETGGTWTQWAGTLPVEAGNNEDFALRFRAYLNESNDRFLLDNVELGGEVVNPEATLAQCSDTQDNDLDGLTDLADTDCVEFKPTLTVVKEVINDNEGTSTPSDFSLTVMRPDSTQTSVQGSAGGVEVTFDTIGSYSVVEEESEGYMSSFSADCSGQIAVGESKTCTVTNNDDDEPGEAMDFGDAPSPYPTQLSNNGARHLPTGPSLGADNRDTESDGFPSALASGDDTAGVDDENGVTFLGAIQAGATSTVRIEDLGQGKLDAWIDFNADGDWSDAGEQIFDSVALNTGFNTLSFLVPHSAATSTVTYARFRTSSEGNLLYDGAANSGEVEDYRIELGASPGGQSDVVACTLLPQEGRIIVDLGDEFIRSDQTLAKATKGPITASIPEGTYDITLQSWDNHSAKPGQVQPNEEWVLRLNGGSTTVATTSKISDLPNTDNYKTELVNNDFVIGSDISSVTAFHSAYPTRNPNSVVPVCVAFDAVEDTGGEQCTVEIVSDDENIVVETGENATSTWTHPAWTATIPGATWIWNTFFVEDPDSEESYTFSKEFDWTGVLDSAVLDVASDNTYKVWVNGTLIGSSTDENNFESGTQDQYDVASHIEAGENEIKIEVTNLASTNDPQENPAGALYKLTLTGEGNSCENPEPTECSDDRDNDNDGRVDMDDPGCQSPSDDDESDDPDVVGYGPYCGDNIVNQDWEQCDGGEGCTQQCQFSGSNQCTDLVLARVVVEDVQNFNPELGADATSDLFIGGDDEEENAIPEGTWFAVHYNGSYITDTDNLNSYADVEGLAVKREAGQVRVRLYGSHQENDGVRAKEHVDGFIEFWNASTTALFSQAGTNKVEQAFNGTQNYNPGNDELDEVSELVDGKGSFWMTVAPSNDGFIAQYSNPPLCGGTTNECVLSGYKYDDEKNPLSDWEIGIGTAGQCTSGDAWADTIESFDQGLRKNGSAVLANRSNEEEALDEAETTGSAFDAGVTPGTFVSLGFGGEIVLEFENLIVDGIGNDLQIYEVTGGTSYPDEKAKIEISQDGTMWHTVAASITRDAALDIEGILPWARFVRVTDISNPDLFAAEDDGFDLDAVKAINCGEALELDMTETDDNGFYCFADVPEEDYYVFEEMEEGWEIEEIVVNGSSTPFFTGLFDAFVEIESGSGTTTVDFYNTQDDDTGGPGGNNGTTTATGTITIIKDANPADGTDFSFNNGMSNAFTLDDADINDGDIYGASTTFMNVATGTHLFMEASTTTWQLTNITCSGDTDQGNVINIPGLTVSIDLDAGEHVTCTFINTKTGTSTATTTPETNNDGGSSDNDDDDNGGGSSVRRRVAGSQENGGSNSSDNDNDDDDNDSDGEVLGASSLLPGFGQLAFVPQGAPNAGFGGVGTVPSVLAAFGALITGLGALLGRKDQ